MFVSHIRECEVGGSDRTMVDSDGYGSSKLLVVKMEITMKMRFCTCWLY